MAKPTKVPVNEKEVADLTRIYKKAYEDVISVILRSPLLNNQHRLEVLTQIREILKELKVKSDDFTDPYIRKMYEKGFQDATIELKKLDLLSKRGFGLIHKDAVKALISETQEAFAESIQGVNRSSRIFLNSIVKEQIKARLAEGAVTGAVRKQIVKNVKATLIEQGLSSLVDKGGKRWSLDRYADMLVRTKAVEARNTALANRMLENGFDLVQVSDHNSDHQACARWEGKILSITGRTKGYPTLEEARENGKGIFHPNCKHAINVINPKLAEKTQAYDSRKKGYNEPKDA